MITVPDPVERLSFCSEGWLREMASGWMETRKARLSAVCALVLGCVVASAAQDAPAPSSTATKKPSTTKTAPKHHSTSSTTTSKSSTAKTSSTKTSSGKTHTASSGKHSHKKSAKVRGQQKIDSERAQSIQEALIREHYLSGEATGTWNQASEDAMRKYQADHGWQSKVVPDSRALIKLGLGPSNDHLLNPESAMTTVPDRPKSNAPAPSSHTAPATSDPATPVSTPPAASGSGNISPQ